MPHSTISSTTQQYLDIYDIANDMVITKRGACSVILSINAMNFDLLAEPEQDAMIYGYAGLLNSLNYSVQILIRSQTKDVSSYVNQLKIKEDETMNRNRREQIRRYREFISDLVQERNVLDKKFYVVVPTSPLELGLVTSQSVIPGVKTPEVATFERSYVVERAKNLLEPRRDHLIAQFARLGLSASQLSTQEIIQLFYGMYNSEAADGQKMADSRSYAAPLVQGGAQDAIFGPPTHHFMAEHLADARSRDAQVQPDTAAAPFAPQETGVFSSTQTQAATAAAPTYSTPSSPTSAAAPTHVANPIMSVMTPIIPVSAAPTAQFQNQVPLQPQTQTSSTTSVPPPPQNQQQMQQAGQPQQLQQSQQSQQPMQQQSLPPVAEIV